MFTITGFLCRLWRCAVAGQGRTSSEGATDQTEGSDGGSPDNLTVISGVGIATQDRLYRAGIKSFAQLAQSSPERVREILGASGRGAKVEDWIKDAATLAKGDLEPKPQS